MDAMQLELSNFQPLAANEAVEQEVQDLGGAEQVLAPIIEKSDQDLASLIRSVGMTSITDIDNLASELQEARNYLHSEGERIRAEIARYTALTEAASASVRSSLTLYGLGGKQTALPTTNHMRVTDAVIEDASGWRDASDGPPRWYG
jgi:hypothetical protein